MNWFLIALVTPITHAVVNHFDKYLLSKYIKGGTVGALILFSALFAVIVLPIILIINPGVLTSVSLWQAIVLMVNGALLTVAILLYLYALDLDEASYVAPFVQFIPVFGLVFGFLILGEVLNASQIYAGALILGGGLLLSIELSAGKKRIKSKLILYMLGCTFFYALNAVIFKFIAVDQGFTNSLFWDMLGKFLLGVVLFYAVKSYRVQFVKLLKQNGARVMGLNIVNEVIGLIGEMALIFAVLYAPVALVQSVSGLQPAFVLIIGVILTLFFPKLGEEKLEMRFIVQKVIGVVIVTAGVYLLEFAK